MLDYLHTMGFAEAFDAMKRQSGLDYVDDGKQKYSGVLEKKWTSVLRLQKKVRRRGPPSALAATPGQLPSLPWTARGVGRRPTQVMDMEKQIAQLQEELAAAPVRKATSSVDWIPRPPEKFTLSGHRSPLTRVVFHPVFSLLGASSSVQGRRRASGAMG